MMRKAVAAVAVALFAGCLVWLHRVTGLSVFLVLTGIAIGALIRILWLERPDERNTPPERPQPEDEDRAGST